jgi:hypothetical protein
MWRAKWNETAPVAIERIVPLGVCRGRCSLVKLRLSTADLLRRLRPCAGLKLGGRHVGVCWFDGHIYGCALIAFVESGVASRPNRGDLQNQLRRPSPMHNAALGLRDKA